METLVDVTRVMMMHGMVWVGVEGRIKYYVLYSLFFVLFGVAYLSVERYVVVVLLMCFGRVRYPSPKLTIIGVKQQNMKSLQACHLFLVSPEPSSPMLGRTSLWFLIFAESLAPFISNFITNFVVKLIGARHFL